MFLFQFDYGSHKSQIKMLQYHTENGRQRITVKCTDTVVVYDKAANTYSNAITLTSFDEEQMTARSKRPFRYKVIKDECQVSGVIYSSFSLEQYSPAYSRELLNFLV